MIIKYIRVTASKQWRCGHCGEPIQPGEKMLLANGGEFLFYKDGHEPKEEDTK